MSHLEYLESFRFSQIHGFVQVKASIWAMAKFLETFTSGVSLGLAWRRRGFDGRGVGGWQRGRWMVVPIRTRYV